MVETSRHHLIARSDKGTWHPDNIRVMKHTHHRAHHLLYGNERPITQLRMNLDFNSSTLIHDCKEEIKMVLEFWDEQGREAYNPKVFKK